VGNKRRGKENEGMKGNYSLHNERASHIYHTAPSGKETILRGGPQGKLISLCLPAEQAGSLNIIKEKMRAGQQQHTWKFKKKRGKFTEKGENSKRKSVVRAGTTNEQAKGNKKRQLFFDEYSGVEGGWEDSSWVAIVHRKLMKKLTNK